MSMGYSVSTPASCRKYTNNAPDVGFQNHDGSVDKLSRADRYRFRNTRYVQRKLCTPKQGKAKRVVKAASRRGFQKGNKEQMKRLNLKSKEEAENSVK